MGFWWGNLSETGHLKDLGAEGDIYLLTYSMEQSPSWEANWFEASQEIPAFYGTRRFITALTSVRHLSLSWASPIQSTYPHANSWRSILILSTHLRLGLPGGLFLVVYLMDIIAVWLIDTVFFSVWMWYVRHVSHKLISSCWVLAFL